MKYLIPIASFAALVAGTAMPAVAASQPSIQVADAVHSRVISDLGRANPRQPVSLLVALRYRNEAQLDQFVDAVSNPYSPMYRHFLSNQQFNAYFAPTPRDYDRVAVALARAGFRVTPSTNGTIIDADAPASTVERYF
ncbi:MAG TPA: protease pro-enzyme activation domain-containing protein, partial [Candidatus Eremiobacteraceae bacterium]